MTKSKTNKSTNRACKAVDSVGLESLIEEAEVCIDSFEYNEAQTKLEEVLKIAPKNLKCMEMLSGVYIEKSMWPEAENLLKCCIKISPESGYSKYFSIGQMYDGLESIDFFKKGIEVLQKELEDDENILPSEENKKSMMIRHLSDAYCSIAEIFMVDCCDEEDAEEKCYSAIDSAIKADPSNPDAFQCLCHYEMVKQNFEKAKEAMEKSLSLWLAHREALEDEDPDKDLENLIPSYESRLKTSQMLIELEMIPEAQTVLHGLLEENNEDYEVWHLLGMVYYLGKGERDKYDAHFYYKKAKEVHDKMCDKDDECLAGLNEILEQLSNSHPVSDDYEPQMDEEEETGDEESEYSTDSENDEEEMETT